MFVSGLMGALGKKNVKNLSRYTGKTQHALMGQMKKERDFIVINKEIIKEVQTEKKRGYKILYKGPFSKI